MRKPALLLSLLLALPAATFLVGCNFYVPTPEGQAVYQYGQFRMLLNTDAARGTVAIDRALDTLNLPVTTRSVEPFHTRLTATSPASEPIVITLEEINSRQSLLRIRVGTLGDRPLSLQLYRLINDEVQKR